MKQAQCKMGFLSCLNLSADMSTLLRYVQFAQGRLMTQHLSRPQCHYSARCMARPFGCPVMRVRPSWLQGFKPDLALTEPKFAVLYGDKTAPMRVA